MNRIAVLIFIAGLWSCQMQNEQSKTSWEVDSPDGELAFHVFLDQSVEDGANLFYQVYSGKDTKQMIIEKSPLGLVRSDQDFSQNLSFAQASTIQTSDETYDLVAGKQTKIRNHFNEQTITFINQQESPVQLVIRAFNDGVAYKYHFPENDQETYTITEELSGFNLPDQGKAWIQPYDQVTKWTPAYEKFFQNGIAIGTTAPHQEGWCFPALFQTANHWVLLTEAGLAEAFQGSHLQPEAPNGLYTMKMPLPEEAEGIGEITPSHTLPWSTLWRVIMVGQDLNTIISNNMVTSLSEPSQLQDQSWIEPGIAAWSWWSDHDSPQNYESLKQFVDLAADMGWQYSLVDANWNNMKGGNIEQLIQYAQQKNVGILMWYNSGGAHNTVEEQPRNRLFDPDKRKAEFAQLEKWGVKGIKVDFFQSDKPFMMQYYLDLIRDAAEHHILVNFHGCTIPRGWSRTYPNFITSESVFGAEAYSFNQDYPAAAPWHNTILPVTRNVIGSMDYTPVTFSDQQYPHITTNGHELALSVVFESGIQHFADRVSAYKELEPAAKTFLRNVPVTWDETRYVDGMPGQEMILARKKGESWYVGGINGEDQAKEFQINLDFLTKGKTYQAIVIKDGEHSRGLVTEEKQYKDLSDITTVSVLPYGGFVIQITPDSQAL
ncbi:MAG: glycoside hydrolase family 97 catalytic domain-containing protein [Candidatus Cyclobacteriaceae bacterium M3_2C_046]